MTNHPNRNWRRKLADAARALGPDLVAAWIAVSERHATVHDALSLLNAATGGSHTTSRLGEWRDGKRAIPEPVQRHMRRIVLAELLGDLRTAAAVEGVMAGPAAE